jgi:hypothetical protein
MNRETSSSYKMLKLEFICIHEKLEKIGIHEYQKNAQYFSGWLSLISL